MSRFAYPKKKWMKNNTGTTDRKKLISKLDKIFSKYIRQRDADKNGMCRCITCLKVAHWKEMDAGHFVSRDRLATRYDERNVNTQCQRCNRFMSGVQYKHGQAIDKKYGAGTAELLVALGGARGTKISVMWIQEKIDEFKNKLKNSLHCSII